MIIVGWSNQGEGGKIKLSFFSVNTCIFFIFIQKSCSLSFQFFLNEFAGGGGWVIIQCLIVFVVLVFCHSKSFYLVDFSLIMIVTTVILKNSICNQINKLTNSLYIN